MLLVWGRVEFNEKHACSSRAVAAVSKAAAAAAVVVSWKSGRKKVCQGMNGERRKECLGPDCRENLKQAAAAAAVIG